MILTEVNLSQESAPTVWEIEAFYDGACPLCRREVNFLRRIDRHGKIRFTNIASDDFCADDYGIELDEFMTEIHGRLPNGTWVRGRRGLSQTVLGGGVWTDRMGHSLASDPRSVGSSLFPFCTQPAAMDRAMPIERDLPIRPLQIQL